MNLDPQGDAIEKCRLTFEIQLKLKLEHPPVNADMKPLAIKLCNHGKNTFDDEIIVSKIETKPETY